MRTFTLMTSSLCLAAASALLLAPSPAQAEVRISVGGSAHVRVGGSIGIRVPSVRWRRPYAWVRPVRPRVAVVPAPVYVGGSYTYVHTGYATPPPPPASCDCAPAAVPAYYGASASASGTVATEPVPAWALGVFAGAIDVDDQAEGTDFGLLARYRLTPAFHLEAEAGQTQLHGGQRLDRRLGAGVAWELWANNMLAPYLTGSVGFSQIAVGGADDAVGGDWTTHQNFAEVGVGLRWRLSPRFDLTADVRGGARQSIGEKTLPADAAARMLAPSTREREDYARARVSAMINF